MDERGQTGAERGWGLLVAPPPARVAAYAEDCVRVDYGDRFAAVLDAGISALIEETWQRVLRTAVEVGGERPVNKRKFRLASAKSESHRVVLQLGPTSYRDYIAFRTSPELFAMAETTARSRRASISEFLPNALGNVGLLLTSDGRSVAVLRSDGVSTYRGYLDLPGGHPEPDCIEDRYWSRNARKVVLESRIRGELFSSILDEIEEDLGVQATILSAPRLLCIVENRQNVMKPDMVFLLRTDCESAELKAQAIREPRGDTEVSGIVTFDPLKPEDTLVGYRLTPVMEGALSVFQEAMRERDHGEQLGSRTLSDEA